MLLKGNWTNSVLNRKSGMTFGDQSVNRAVWEATFPHVSHVRGVVINFFTSWLNLQIFLQTGSRVQFNNALKQGVRGLRPSLYPSISMASYFIHRFIVSHCSVPLFHCTL